MDALWLIRHGETEWSREGKHTSHTDLPLTAAGRKAALSLRERLRDHHFDAVFSSPRRRALDTARLAGFPAPVVLVELAEWDYGEFEGLTTAEIRQSVPEWTVWTRPSPGGEAASDVTERLDRALDLFRTIDGIGLVFGHSHSLRALAGRWIGTKVDGGRYLQLDTATVSVLSFERETPVVERWNS